MVCPPFSLPREHVSRLEGEKKMAEFEVTANGKRHGSVIAVFADGSTVQIGWHSIQFDLGLKRQAYTYVVTAENGDVIESGHDLRSGCGARIDFVGTLDSWLSFAMSDAERYRAKMDGTPFEEWAYQHDDELQVLSCDLEDN